jgi:hypothetical protein
MRREELHDATDCNNDDGGSNGGTDDMKKRRAELERNLGLT